MARGRGKNEGKRKTTANQDRLTASTLQEMSGEADYKQKQKDEEQDLCDTR